MNQQIQAGYDQMWQAGRPDLLNGDIDADPLPDATCKRWGISAVLRPSRQLAQALAGVTSQLNAFAGAGHTIYDPTTLHITLRSIEFFRSAVSPPDERVRTYARLLRQLAPCFSEFTVEFRGLSANRVGVILQGFPTTDQLPALRRAFHALLDRHHLLDGPEQAQPRLNTHMSLVVYGRPALDDAVGLVDYVEQHRSTDFGQLTTHCIDLVRYERQVDAVQVITLDRIGLGKT